MEVKHRLPCGGLVELLHGDPIGVERFHGGGGDLVGGAGDMGVIVGRDVEAGHALDAWRAMGARQALLTRLQQTVLQEPLPLLRQIRAPTLLVWGEADAMIPVAHAQDYLRAIEGSRLLALPQAGHLPQEEAASASLQAVAAFLH